jgi:hypothetical protein
MSLPGGSRHTECLSREEGISKEKHSNGNLPGFCFAAVVHILFTKHSSFFQMKIIV